MACLVVLAYLRHWKPWPGAIRRIVVEISTTKIRHLDDTVLTEPLGIDDDKGHDIKFD